MQNDLQVIAARDLAIGQRIRLTDSRFDKIKAIGFEDGQFIVGGPFNKTATALRVTTMDGTSFLVHPGQTVGVSD